MMTPTLLFTRLQAALKTMVWAGTVSKIFGDAVYLVTEIPALQLSRYSSPSAFIVDGGAVPHTEHPGLQRQNFSIAIFVENTQNVFGESSLMGGCRVAGTSAGAGILAIEAEYIKQIIETVVLTAKVILVEKSRPSGSIVKGNAPHIIRSVSFMAWTSIY